jgi:hypothetical protein
VVMTSYVQNNTFPTFLETLQNVIVVGWCLPCSSQVVTFALLIYVPAAAR